MQKQGLKSQSVPPRGLSARLPPWRCEPPGAGPQGPVAERLGQWFEGPVGRRLIEQEWACLDAWLEDLFGYYLIQIGCLGVGGEPLRASRIRTQVVIAQGPAEGIACTWMQADPARLPLATDSVDVVLLPHTLDFSPDPRSILREAERVLIPGGRVIVLGFNPWSLWGLRRLVQLRGGIPWCGHFLSRSRMRDWLSLLGFEEERSADLMYGPPMNLGGLLARARLLERAGRRLWPRFAGVYALQGIKRVSTLTPIRPSWSLRKEVLGGRAIEPTTRQTDRG